LASDLAAGQIKVGFVSTAGVLEHVRAGRLKGLAISGSERSSQAPEIPTIAEAGYDFRRETYYVLAVPAGTPEPIAATLEREVRSALQSPDLVERFRAVNINIVGSSGDEAKARVAADGELWSKVIDTLGMRVD
jgi:tripartite-type tricarboxylate transporter receptor subunit TctC